jgi:hypothetical protein
MQLIKLTKYENIVKVWAKYQDVHRIMSTYAAWNFLCNRYAIRVKGKSSMHEAQPDNSCSMRKSCREQYKNENTEQPTSWALPAPFAWQLRPAPLRQLHSRPPACSSCPWVRWWSSTAMPQARCLVELVWNNPPRCLPRLVGSQHKFLSKLTSSLSCLNTKNFWAFWQPVAPTLRAPLLVLLQSMHGSMREKKHQNEWNEKEVEASGPE